MENNNNKYIDIPKEKFEFSVAKEKKKYYNINNN